ncbi:MAG: HEAT repeat domain-containing protein [Rhizonema sp. PD37]|nr:HEAT repeat domain-containing protein [Rhizonema sp. PD37]
MNTQNHDIERLISQLNNASLPTDAISALTALEKSGTTEAAIAAVIQALSHHHPSVRTTAIEVLVRLAPTTVEPLIIAYRNSTDQGLQAHIIQALAQIGDSRATDLLAEVVGTTVANHCQGNIRRIAARGLGRICALSQDSFPIDNEKTFPLSALNTTTQYNVAVEKLTWALLTPEDWGLRYAAAVSLQEIATSVAYVALQQASDLESDKVVLSRIANALEQFVPRAGQF